MTATEPTPEAVEALAQAMPHDADCHLRRRGFWGDRPPHEDECSTRRDGFGECQGCDCSNLEKARAALSAGYVKHDERGQGA